jgi:hypothetical protein
MAMLSSTRLSILLSKAIHPAWKNTWPLQIMQIGGPINACVCNLGQYDTKYDTKYEYVGVS